MFFGASFARRAISGVCNPAERLHSDEDLVNLTLFVSPSICLNRIPSVSGTPGKASKISSTKLSNGLTVVTEDASYTSTVTLTYPKAGSSSEGTDEQGAALTNKCMNFMSGSGLSTLLINRTIEDKGGFPFSTVDRSSAVVGFTVAREHALGLVPLLATDCSFEKWDMRDAKAMASQESAVANESAQIVLTEHLYAAAYGPQSTAGRPLYGTPCSTDAIHSFRSRAYGLNGAVLAATGVTDHAQFCAEAEGLLKDSPAGSDSPPPATAYMGGESRVSVPSAGLAHVALGLASTASPVVASVVAQLLSLAGKETGVSAFTIPGMVGLYACGSGTLTDAMVATVKTAPSKDLVTRAKGLAKASALFALDGGSKSLAASMTASVVSSAPFSSPSDVAKMYDAVTDKQVADAVAALLKSNPALAAVGDISAVPYHATVAASLK